MKTGLNILTGMLIAILICAHAVCIAVPADFDGDGISELAIAADKYTVFKGDENHGIFSLYAYGDRLYAGAFGDISYVYSSHDGETWHETATVPVGESVYKMIHFNGWMYAGTEAEGELWRFMPDGSNLQEVLLPYAGLVQDKHAVFALEIYYGQLYAALTLRNPENMPRESGCYIYRSVSGGGDTWTQVGGKIPYHNVREIAAYKGELYVLVDNNRDEDRLSGSEGGGALYVLAGNAWQRIHVFPDNEIPLRVTVWNGYLWITTFNQRDPGMGALARIFRWDEVSNQMLETKQTSEYRSFSALKVYHGSLYAAASEFFKWPGQATLFRLDDPENWQWREVCRFKEAGVMALEVFNGHLYVGSITWDDAQNTTRARIYRDPREGLTWYIRDDLESETLTVRGMGCNQLCPGYYDADGKADLAVFDQPSGTWWIRKSTAGMQVEQMDEWAWGMPIRGDFDGDGISDCATYHPYEGGKWHIRKSSGGFRTETFGYAGTVPVVGDFDGDGIDDYGCYDAAGNFGQPPGSWYLMQSSAGFQTRTFGYAGTVPVVGDFDGDGTYDYGCYDAEGHLGQPPGSWYLMQSSAGFQTRTFGYAGTVPVVGDFDGDGIDDYGCYDAAGNYGRPPGSWYLMQSSAGFQTKTFGYAGTVPHVADFDGDGIDDYGCYDAEGNFGQPAGSWYVMQSTAGFENKQVGMKGKAPIAGDFDGDGLADFGTYSAGDWYFLKTGDGWSYDHFGYGGTVPVIGDFDGDRTNDYGCYDAAGIPGLALPGSWYFRQSTDGFVINTFGYAGTVPVVGDFDGDGTYDYGCYDAAGNYGQPAGSWYIMQSSAGFRTETFGYAGTVPVVTDYDGDETDDLACFDQIGHFGASPATWYIMQSTDGFITKHFGSAETEPIPADYDADGKADVAVRGPQSIIYVLGTSSGYWTNKFGW